MKAAQWAQCLLNTINEVFALDVKQYILINSKRIWNFADRMVVVILTMHKAEAARLNQLLGTSYKAGRLAVYTSLTVDGDAMMHWRKACHAILDKAEPSCQIKNMIKVVLQNLTTTISSSDVKQIDANLLRDQNLVQKPLHLNRTMQLLEEISVLDLDLMRNQQYIQKLLYEGRAK